MIDLEAVKARGDEAGRCLALLNEWSADAHCQWLVERTALAVADVPALVAEVERLRGELARMKSTPVAGFCSCTPIPKLRVGQFLIACETCRRMRYVDSTPTTSSKRFRVDL